MLHFLTFVKCQPIVFYTGVAQNPEIPQTNSISELSLFGSNKVIVNRLLPPPFHYPQTLIIR